MNAGVILKSWIIAIIALKGGVRIAESLPQSQADRILEDFKYVGTET
jgi:hypothetical protein